MKMFVGQFVGEVVQVVVEQQLYGGEMLGDGIVELVVEGCLGGKMEIQQW